MAFVSATPRTSAARKKKCGTGILPVKGKCGTGILPVRSQARRLYHMCHILVVTTVLLPACHLPTQRADRDVATLIRARQQEVLGRAVAVPLGDDGKAERPGRAAYRYDPRPTTLDVPDEFNQVVSADEVELDVASDADAPGGEPPRVFTLTDALAYAQRHRREYQSAKEDLYLSALSLTLERHLWTPIFASNLKTVYGNFGETTDFDQAMRFVADLSVAQRLPFGGEFTAKAVSTLIRDVKRSITAKEGGEINLGLNIPLLRGAGHVARETLIQLQRELTYSVRTFERFRRQQLVSVAQEYFSLLQVKQRMIDTADSYERRQKDHERAKAFQDAGLGSLLDTQRAEQAMLSEQNAVEDSREAFRTAADNFKLLIGMPVDRPLGRDHLEDIETIETRVVDGLYPLLAHTRAVDDEPLALKTALERRLDLLTIRDRVDDTRRGVAISRNALLPNLNWSASLALDSDPEHFNAGDARFDRANWHTEVTLELPLERTAERNELRRAMIDLRRAQRRREEQAERITAEVRQVVNRVRLQERSLEIQRRNVGVAERSSQYAQMLYEDGDIDNRDRLDFERTALDARNRLNAAKTARWSALLQFRLATETLLIGEDGAQAGAAEPDMDRPIDDGTLEQAN